MRHEIIALIMKYIHTEICWYWAQYLAIIFLYSLSLQVQMSPITSLKSRVVLLKINIPARIDEILSVIKFQLYSPN